MPTSKEIRKAIDCLVDAEVFGMTARQFPAAIYSEIIQRRVIKELPIPYDDSERDQFRAKIALYLRLMGVSD